MTLHTSEPLLGDDTKGYILRVVESPVLNELTPSRNIAARSVCHIDRIQGRVVDIAPGGLCFDLAILFLVESRN